MGAERSSLPLVVAELQPLVRSFAQSEYGLALGGAHAKGKADAESDLDLYLFATAIWPSAERRRLTLAFSPEVAHVVCWGDDATFSQAGTDFHFRGHQIECWLRNATDIDYAIAECQAGHVTRDFVTWTTTGFYNHCCLSDINVMVPLEDPTGLLARWKAQVAMYPPALKRTIISQHLAAAQFWPENFHYRSAVERADIIYTTGIVQQVVHNLIQVLFAFNETYFPGDKQLARAFAHLPHLPERWNGRVQALLWPEAPPTVEILRHQQAELQALVREVTAMVEN